VRERERERGRERESACVKEKFVGCIFVGKNPPPPLMTAYLAFLVSEMKRKEIIENK